MRLKRARPGLSESHLAELQGIPWQTVCMRRSASDSSARGAAECQRPALGNLWASFSASFGMAILCTTLLVVPCFCEREAASEAVAAAATTLLAGAIQEPAAQIPSCCRGREPTGDDVKAADAC